MRRPTKTVPLTSLARFAPIDTGVFIEFRRLDQLQDELRTLNAWRVSELLLDGGRTSADRDRRLDWGRVVSDNLGVPLDRAIKTIFAGQVAFAAPSWEHVRDGVILIRLTDPEHLNLLVSPGQVSRTYSQGPRVTAYQTKRGLWVATDRQFVLLSQRGEASAFCRKAIALLKGTNQQSLLGVRTYAGQVRQLGSDCAGHVYFTTGGGRRTFEFWPECRWGVIGVYVRKQRLDFVVRARLAQPREEAYRPRVAADRLVRLPRSTLLVWSGSVNFARAYRDMVEDATSLLGQLLSTLNRTMPGVDDLQEELLELLGPRVVFAWGHGAGPAGQVPHLAVLVESRDAVAAAATLERMAATIVGEPRPPASQPTTQPSVSPILVRREHLGTAVVEIPLGALFATAPKGSIVDRWRGPIRPSFAALDGWLVIALSPDHLRRIIDADRGLVPRLGDLAEVRTLATQRARPITIGFAQPALCAEVIHRWLAELETQQDSPWRTILGAERPRSPARPRALGIGMRTQQRPGRVTVARVYPGTAAHGLLRPGDEIFGADGRLLALAEPNADLRGLIRAKGGQGSITLRVWRDSEYVDVDVPLQPPVADVRRSPAVEALDRLARLGVDLRYSAYTVLASRPDYYVARLAVGFEPPDPVSRGPDETGSAGGGEKGDGA